MKPRVLIPVSPGTNRDGDLALAFELAGAEPVRVPISAVRDGEVSVDDFQIVGLAGGFSYGDALGAGHVLGLDVLDWLASDIGAALDRGLLVFGVCNGFQALVASGLLPGPGGPPAALRHNLHHRFECRWVRLHPLGRGPWFGEVSGELRCPVAHGEGRFVTADVDALAADRRLAFTYVGDDASGPAGYPANPNGSAADIAGITDGTGAILGLMPHPENHVVEAQDPHAGRRPSGSCLPLFRSAVTALAH